MKYLFIIFSMVFILLSGYGQRNITYIKQQVENLENQLIKKGEHLKLTNSQLEKLSVIFTDKFARVETVLSKFIKKSDVSNEITKIEDEFTPKVESILNFEQRLALHQDKKKPLNTASEKQ